MAVKKTTKKSTKKTVIRKKTTTGKAAVKPAKKRSAAKKSPVRTPVKKTASSTTKRNVTTKAAVQKIAAKPTQDQFSANIFAAAVPDFKEMEKIMTKQPFQFDQLTQEAANNSRESVEAFVKSGEIFAKGFENIIKTAASLTQTAAETQAEFAKTLMGSKTLNEYTEAQNKIAQANFDQFMSSATTLSEMSVKILSEASEPLNEQMTKAMQKANSQMAA